MTCSNNSLAEEEMRHVKEKYGQLHSVGELAYLVDIKIAEFNVTLKIQIQDSYPNEVPDVIVRAPALRIEDIQTLHDYIMTDSITLCGNPMIDIFVSKAQDWLLSQNIAQVSVNLPLIKGETAGRYRNKKQSKSKKSNNDDTVISSKKPPMKTADDVIKRIQWDENLSSDDFTVGYLDRFCGITEKKFTAFTWEDLASVDYTALAIPRHRIEYFKYKSQKVWDKRSRLDNVFGSVGSGLTIKDVIEKYLLENESHGSDDQHSAKIGSDSSIVEFPIDLNCDHGSVSVATLDIGEKLHSPMEDGDKLKPTHFLCVRVTDPCVLEKITDVQNKIVQEEILYEDCCISLDALHITLCVLHLPNHTQVLNACQALHDWNIDLAPLKKKRIILTLQGVADFNARIVHVKVDKNNDYDNLVHEMIHILQGANVDIVKRTAKLEPHVTILKPSKDVEKQMGKKEVDPSLYADFVDNCFGIQHVDEILLCEISRYRREDGFYLTSSFISLL